MLLESAPTFPLGAILLGVQVLTFLVYNHEVMVHVHYIVQYVKAQAPFISLLVQCSLFLTFLPYLYATL